MDACVAEYEFFGYCPSCTSFLRAIFVLALQGGPEMRIAVHCFAAAAGQANIDIWCAFGNRMHLGSFARYYS